MSIDISKKPEDLELFHHGIKGMKWGIRRKEGPDGTVSSAVSAKGSGGTSKGGSSSSETTSEDHKSSRNLKTKNVESLSNNQIKELNKRLELETNYNRLMNTDSGKTAVDRGIQKTEKILKVVNLATQIYKLKDNPLVKLGASAIAGKIANGGKSSGIPDLEGLFPNPRAQDRKFA